MPHRPGARSTVHQARTPRHVRRAAALLLPVLLTVIAGCTAGPSSRPPVAMRGEDSGELGPTGATSARPPVPPLDQPKDADVGWEDCTGPTAAKLSISPPPGLPFACGRITGVLDPPGLPGRGNVRLAALKAGSGPIPLVVVNDTTGEPGTLFAARLASQLPRELLNTFSLVAVDRRGTGESEPTNCVPEQARTTMVGFDPAAGGKGQLGPLLDAARGATQECAMALDKRVVAFDSWRSAGDLDTLRQALGMPRLNAIGRGTGSAVLTTYRERFGGKVGRMVLDGAPDPKLDDIGQNEARAAGAEAALDAYGADCAAHSGCPLAPDAKQALPALAQQLTRQPLATPDGTQVTGGLLYQAVLDGLADRSRWPALTDALAKAKTGDGSRIAQLVAPVVNGAEDQPPRFDALLTSECNDTTTRAPLERVIQLADEWKGKHPVFGLYFAHRLLVCAPWPTATQALPTPAAGGPPALTLATAADPITPLNGTQRMAGQIAAVLVQWQGAGHGAFPNSSCVTSAVQHYLVDGRMPSSDVVCPP